MKNFIVIFLIMLFGQSYSHISKAEYFIDVDPGIGNGATIYIIEDFSPELYIIVNTTGLDNGFHTLYIRVQDTEGAWSLYEKQTFHLNALSNDSQITTAEYFFDDGPSIGYSIPVNVTEGFIVNEDLGSITYELDPGFHTLFLRVRDQMGNWSLYDKQIFRIQESGPIILAEYFVDQDPGIGNANEIIINPGFNINEETDLSTLDLDPGVHTLYIRVKDNQGQWSEAESSEFNIILVDGISEQENSSFVIYPNPSTESVFVKSDWSIEELLVYDMTGKLMKKEIQKTQINVQDLTRGNYILQVKTSSDTQQFNFIKE